MLRFHSKKTIGSWRWPLSVANLVSWCCLASALSHATVVLQLTEREQVRRAHLIATAEVLSQQTRKLGVSGHIVTDSLLRVTRFLKGKTASNLLTVRTMGGTYQGITAHVHGETRLQPKQRVLLFLTPAPPSPWDKSPTYYYVVGMARGAYTLFFNSKTQQTELFRQADLPTTAHRGARRRWHHQAAAQSTPPLALKVMISRIQAHLQALRTLRPLRALLPSSKPTLLPHSQRQSKRSLPAPKISPQTHRKAR